METPMERVVLSVEEATAYIGIKRATLYRLMDSGAL